MSLIRKWGNEENNLPEFENCWEQYRNMTANGIFRASDADVRNLHAQMSMMLSHKIIQQSVVTNEYERQKFLHELKKSELLYTKYNKGTVAANNAAMMNDLEFQESYENLMKAKEQQIIIESEISSLQTAVTSLSREISARLKYL